MKIDISNKILNILNRLDSLGYSTLNIDLNSTYNYNDNTFCTFQFSNLKSWKFAIWLDKNDQYYFFGEHLLLIDKFKPSTVNFSVYLNLYSDFDFNILCDMLKDLFDNNEYYFVSGFVLDSDFCKYEDEIDLNIPINNKSYYKNISENILNYYLENEKVLKEEENLLIDTVLKCLDKFDIKGIGIYDRNKNKSDCISYSHRFIINIMCDNKEILNDIESYLNQNLNFSSGIKYILNLKDNLNNLNCHFIKLKL